MKQIDYWTPKVGMEVFIVPNWTRRSPMVDTITKVGKKYFYVGRYCREKYSIETKDEENGELSSQSHCYRCEADYNRVVELREKRREIERNIHKLTAEQVDKVYEWLFNNNKTSAI